MIKAVNLNQAALFQRGFIIRSDIDDLFVKTQFINASVLSFCFE